MDDNAIVPLSTQQRVLLQPEQFGRQHGNIDASRLIFIVAEITELKKETNKIVVAKKRLYL